METVHSEDRYLVPPQGGPALIRRIAGTSLSVLSDILTTSRPALLAEESEWVPLPLHDTYPSPTSLESCTHTQPRSKPVDYFHAAVRTTRIGASVDAVIADWVKPR